MRIDASVTVSVRPQATAPAIPRLAARRAPRAARARKRQAARRALAIRHASAKALFIAPVLAIPWPAMS